MITQSHPFCKSGRSSHCVVGAGRNEDHIQWIRVIFYLFLLLLQKKAKLPVEISRFSACTNIMCILEFVTVRGCL